MGSFTVTILFAAIAMMGLQGCYGCTEIGIQQCMAGIDALAEKTFKEKNPDFTPLCGSINKGFNCLKQETSNCPASLDTLVNAIKKGMQIIVDDCKNPGDIHFNDTCPYAAYDDCVKKAVPSSRSMEEVCLAMGKAYHCAQNFLQATCPSKFMRDLVKMQTPTIDATIKKCHDAGYSTDSAAIPRQVVALPLLASVLAVLLRHLL